MSAGQRDQDAHSTMTVPAPTPWKARNLLIGW